MKASIMVYQLDWRSTWMSVYMDTFMVVYMETFVVVYMDVGIHNI